MSLNRTLMNPWASSLSRAEQEFRSGHYRIARSLFKKLANNNNAPAHYWLADMAEYGLGAPPDRQKALDLYKRRRARALCPPNCASEKSTCAETMVLPDFAKAKKYLEEAAFHGSARAARVAWEDVSRWHGPANRPKGRLCVVRGCIA